MVVSINEQPIIKRLVTSANNTIFLEDIDVAAGTQIELATATGDIDTSDQLTMASAFQKVFIANGANLKVADFINTRLTHTALTTAHARDDILTQASSAASMIVSHTNTAKTLTYGYTTTGTWDFSNSVTGSGSGTAFTPTGIAGVLTHTALATAHAADDVLTQAGSSATMTVTATDVDKKHTYGTITAGTWNTSGQATGSGSGTAFTPTVVSRRPPVWYTWTVEPGGLSGALPAKAYLITVYRGRLVLSGNPRYPNQWFMSKLADPFNWLYGADDPMSAVAGNNADAGQCPDIVRSLISFHDDYLIFGCASTIWLLRGDPVAGGSLDNLSDTTGMFGANSWCFDDARNLYFWGSGGLYEIKSDFSGIRNLTEMVLPDIINDEAADPSTHRITMGYDKKRHGIVVAITVLATGVNSNYFYSFKTKGFYPESYPNECGPYSIFYYDANDTTFADLLLGSKDGYIRKFLTSAKNDDIGGSDTAISSYVTYPITPLSQVEDQNGKLTELVFDLSGGAAGGDAGDTDGVTYELHKGNDAETVLEDIVDGATAFLSETLSGTGRKNKIKPRMKGAYWGLKLFNSTASETWAINRVLYGTVKAGKVR
ncbi:hypothetical protein LCGC14_1040220 [marine sediment metagenome]|uniref:Uncharacterized protein n=1 Tax=marine sediment metagenome TaxID=412755 RepID=A0A0F9MRY4_9ZZZZ